jgi:hypothetical protein
MVWQAEGVQMKTDEITDIVLRVKNDLNTTLSYVKNMVESGEITYRDYDEIISLFNCAAATVVEFEPKD